MKRDDLLRQLSQRNHYLRKILNESPIVTFLTKETPNLKWTLQNLPFHHRLDLGQIDQYILLVEKVPQKVHLIQLELTLGELRIQSLLPHGL